MTASPMASPFSAIPGPLEGCLLHGASRQLHRYTAALFAIEGGELRNSLVVLVVPWLRQVGLDVRVRREHVGIDGDEALGHETPRSLAADSDYYGAWCAARQHRGSLF